MEDKQPGGVRERGGRVQSGVRVDAMQKSEIFKGQLAEKERKEA